MEGKKEKIQKITQGCRLGWVDAGKLGDSGGLTGIKEMVTASGDIGELGPKDERHSFDKGKK